MHRAAYEAIRRMASDIDLSSARVLEIGSYDVNGSPRAIFASCAEYTGVDMRSGKGVDIVADITLWETVDKFDVIVCAEVLEHVPDQQAVIDAAARRLAPDGVLIVTAAGHGRASHNIDGGHNLRGEPYHNITKARMTELLAGWGDIEITTNPGDIYARATYANSTVHTDAS